MADSDNFTTLLVAGAGEAGTNGTYTLFVVGSGTERVWKHNDTNRFIRYNTTLAQWTIATTNTASTSDIYYTGATSSASPYISSTESYTWTASLSANAPGPTVLLGGATSTSKLCVGATAISKIYFGSTEVSKVYIGSTAIYESSTEPSTGTITATSPQTFTGTQGTSFVGTLSATASTGATCVFALKTGYSLPDGLSMGSMGGISGTPTSSGTTSVVMVVSATGCTSIEITVNFTFAAATPVITVTTPVTITGTVGQPLSYQLEASVSDGGQPSFIVTSLPAGITCSSTGLISGTPTSKFGPSSLTASVSYTGATTKTIDINMTIADAASGDVVGLLVSGISGSGSDYQPNALMNGNYYLVDPTATGTARVWKHESQTYYIGILTGSGVGRWAIGHTNPPPYNWYTDANLDNPYNEDGSSVTWWYQGSVYQDASVTPFALGPTISIQIPKQLSAVINEPVSLQLVAVDNTGATCVFALEDGTTLPAGLTLSSTGLISGTPTAITPLATYNVVVTSDSGATAKVIPVKLIVASTLVTDPTVIVSGCSTTACDGTYYLVDTSAEGDSRIWKHESQNYYISLTTSTDHWIITTSSTRLMYPSPAVTYTSSTGYDNPGPDDGSSYTWYNQSNISVIYTTGPIIAVTTPVTVSIAQNESLSHQLIASDNTGATVTFALDATSPAWPTGVTMSNTGLISGTPTVIQAMTARTINVSSTSGATTKQIIFNLMVRDPAVGAPVAIEVTGANAWEVNRIFDIRTIADETKPTHGDRYCSIANTTSLYKMEYYVSGDTKQWRLFGASSSQRYYADCITGYEWPDDPTLVWAANSGSAPMPTVTATTARTMLSQMKITRAGQSYYNDITYTSYNQAISGTSPTVTDAIWTAYSTGYGCIVFVKVANVTGGYVWQIGYTPNSQGSSDYVAYQTYNPVADIADLKWPWDRTDWYVTNAGSQAPVPLVTDPNGSVTQAVGAYTGKMVIHSAGTTAVNNTYTCDNQSIDDERPKPYVRFTYGNYLCVLTQYNSMNYYRWAIYNVSTSYSQQYYYQSSSTFTESNAVWPWDDSLTWSTSYGSAPVPLFLKGDGSDGGLKYGDYLMEEPTTGTTIRFIYTGSSIGVEPSATDVWTSKDGTKTISWDSTNKWWQYKTGSTVEYHTTAYTSATPYQFPWEYTDESWVTQGGSSGSSDIVVQGTAADEYGLAGTYTFRSDITLDVMNYQGPASELPNGGCWVMGEGVAAPVIFAYYDGSVYYYDVTDLSSSMIYTSSDPSSELVEPWNATWSDDIVINQA